MSDIFFPLKINKQNARKSHTHLNNELEDFLFNKFLGRKVYYFFTANPAICNWSRKSIMFGVPLKDFQDVFSNWTQCLKYYEG